MIFGKAIKEIPKCEYPVYLQMVELWDDFRVIHEIKKKAGGTP